MKQRVLVAILLVLFFAPLIVTTGFEPLAYVVFGCLNIMGAFELYRLRNNKTFNYSKFIFISFAATLVYLLTTCLSMKIINIPIITMVSSITIYVLLLVFRLHLTGKTSDSRIILQAIFYPSIGFGMITNLRILGVKYILFAILITSLTDSFALFAGKLFGKHKLAPKISPKKTIEGAVLGTLITSLILVPLFYYYDKIFSKSSVLKDSFSPTDSFFLDFIPNYNETHFILLVFIIFLLVIVLSMLGQIGDLYASKIKREHNIKDYSKIFPGHGGVLDRFDSLIFVATALGSIILLCQLVS